MMQDGDQDGHLNHGKRENGLWLNKNYSKCIFEPHHEKTKNVVSEQARHKTSYTNTEDE